MTGDDGSLNICEDCGIELAPDDSEVNCGMCRAEYDIDDDDDW